MRGVGEAQPGLGSPARYAVAAAYVTVAVTCSASVGGYVWSRAFGLPQIGGDVRRWTEPLGVVAIVAESLAVALALAALGPLKGRRLPRRVPAAVGALVLITGLGATTAAAVSPQQDGAMTDMAMSGPAYWNRVGGGAVHVTGRIRTYYIGADEVVWNYAPTGTNQITGEPFDDAAKVFVQQGPGRIGSSYLKCLYRGYTDETFGHLEARPADQAYLGVLGPVVRAEVGDTIKVVFRNGCRFATGVHPHGVFYAKDSEGALYNDGTTGADKADDAVPTGGQHTYLWQVPDRAGPGPGDGSSVMWMYHGHTDEIADTYAGLMGPMVVTARGQARADGSPKDVDRELFAMYAVMNENASPYLGENIRRFAGPPTPPELVDDEGFGESNLMHSINGYVFGNMPMIRMAKGEHVRWYVMGMGTEVDLHTPHWHGNTVTVSGMRMDVVNLLPMSMVVADMVADNPGTWLFHCHVADHIAAGMLTRYQVTG